MNLKVNDKIRREKRHFLTARTAQSFGLVLLGAASGVAAMSINVGCHKPISSTTPSAALSSNNHALITQKPKHDGEDEADVRFNGENFRVKQQDSVTSSERQTRTVLEVKEGEPYQCQVLQSVYDGLLPASFRVPVSEKDKDGTKQSAPPIRFLGDVAMDDYTKDLADDQSSNGQTGQMDGEYDEDGDQITLRGSLDPQDLAFTFAHEYGHYVWYRQLSRADRERFTHLWKAGKRRDELVTEYAGSSCPEGFAEAFSFYVLLRPLLASRDPEAYHFIAHLDQAKPTIASR